MKSSAKHALTIILLISLCVYTVPAQQISTATKTGESSGAKSLAEKRRSLRESLVRQIYSLQRYRANYGARFSARERKAVADLIRSLENELGRVDAGSELHIVVVNAKPESNHALKLPGSVPFAASVSSAIEPPAPDATPAPTPDPVLAELDKRISELEKRATIATKEKEIAESEAALATAEKNRILNMLPTPTATPLTGATTVADGAATFQGDLLAYKSLADIAAQIRTDLNGISGTIIIHNDADINALNAYGIMVAQIKTIITRYKALNQELSPGAAEEVGAAAVFAAPQVASTLLRSVADVAALFRTNTTITGLTITPDQTVLNAEIGAALRQGNLRVFEPKLYLPNLFSHPNSEIIGQLGNLTQLKTRAERSVADFDALTPEQKKAHLKRVTFEKMRALNTQVESLITNLMRVDETTKQSPLMGLYRAEKLNGLLEDGASPCHVLYLKLAKAEGARTIKSNLFTGTKTSYSGGMIVSYTLFDRDGQMVKSGIRGSLRGSQNLKPTDNVLLKLP
jgi:hypothetical protein